MGIQVVVMGVAGCGKSSLAAELARAERLPLIEGDDFHSAESRAKMAAGIPLADADRAGWLRTLGEQLQAHDAGLVLTCSALKLAYRQQLRAAAPGLRFVFMQIERAASVQRVSARGAHFFNASLVDSQFATLEPPTGEPGVLTVDALQPIAMLQARASAWLHERTA